MADPSVLRAEELQPGESAVVTVEGQEVALFNVEGCFYAIANRCPHRNAPLARGHLEGKTIRCALHGWLFDLTSGVCLNQPEVSTPVYKVEPKDGQLHVESLA